MYYEVDGYVRTVRLDARSAFSSDADCLVRETVVDEVVGSFLEVRGVQCLVVAVLSLATRPSPRSGSLACFPVSASGDGLRVKVAFEMRVLAYGLRVGEVVRCAVWKPADDEAGEAAWLATHGPAVILLRAGRVRRRSLAPGDVVTARVQHARPVNDASLRATPHAFVSCVALDLVDDVDRPADD